MEASSETNNPEPSLGMNRRQREMRRFAVSKGQELKARSGMGMGMGMVLKKKNMDRK